jgi:hypothetical protein
MLLLSLSAELSALRRNFALRQGLRAPEKFFARRANSWVKAAQLEGCAGGAQV